MPSANQQLARAFARRLIEVSRDNGPDADRARAELAALSREVSDLVADELVRAMDRDALRVCAVYSSHVVPYWFESGRSKMVAKLEQLARSEPVLGSFAAVLRTVQVRREKDERAGLGRRIGSALVRPWVIGFVWIPVCGAVLAVVMVEDLTLRAALAAGIVLALAGVVAIEGHGRRCPTCRTWLGGMPVGLRHTGSYTETLHVSTPRGTEEVTREGSSYAELLRCVRCGHRWER